MAPPVAVYVVATVVGIAAVFAFKEFVYEPHIAPTLEAWAENFLERRRAARNRRASAVSVRTSRHHRTSPPSSVSSHHTIDAQEGGGEASRPPATSVDEFELEALAAREVDEWRNQVLRSQDRTRDGLRKRRMNNVKEDFDGFDSSTTLDESFTSLTHTPLASTHVISDVSASLPSTPTRRLRSASQTTIQGDVGSSITVPHSSASPIRDMQWEILTPDCAVPTPRLFDDSADKIDFPSLSPLGIPVAVYRSPTNEGVPHPLPFTPTYQIMADDSPFGPILPDTPGSSVEMYGERPFSPITRVMGSSSSHVSVPGSKGTLSRADSMNSIRTLGGSAVPRKRSGLVNEVLRGGSDDEEDYHPFASTSTFEQPDLSRAANESVISSLSERYPVPPASPVIVSPPASSFDVISAPSSPRGGDLEVIIQRDRSTSPPHQTYSSLPVLQLPPDSSNQHPGLIAQSRSAATSPALSFASFLSSMPISRTASESEGDEFLSVGGSDNDSGSDSSEVGDRDSEDGASDWSASPVSPSQGGAHMSPVHDRAHNPFLDFEHGVGSERGDGESEGSEVLVPEGGSEAGSDESWGLNM